eukprot:568067-Pyramimonas_sp.AAC.1
MPLGSRDAIGAIGWHENLRFPKAKAHQSLDAHPAGTTDWADTLGNHGADRFAGIASRGFNRPSETETREHE